VIERTENIGKNLLRDNLLIRFEGDNAKPVAWVSGPPGSGKTNLVSTYVKDKTPVIIWYEIEAGDEDPATFFHYLSENIKKKCRFPNNWVTPLKPEFLPSVEVYARQFFQLLCESINQPFILVLDQYQELPDDSIIHQLIKHFIRALPSRSSIIFLSRTEPPASLARFIVNQQIEYIGWNDLRFTSDEIDALGRLWGFCDKEMQLLESAKPQINGWVAGAVLFCDFIRNVKKVPEKLDLTNSDILLNYFSGEILNQLSEVERSFLFQIAFLPRFDPEIATELTGIKNSPHIIERLYNNHSFTEKLSYSSNEYQLHPLFRRFLRSRINEEWSTADIRQIKQRAAVCLEKQGLIDHAITYWFAAQQWGELSRIAETYTDVLIEQGRGNTVAKWFQQIPTNILEKNPCFSYWRARAVMPYDTNEARYQYKLAYDNYSLINTDINKKWLCWAGCVATYIHEWKAFKELDFWISELSFLPSDFPAGCNIETKASVTSAMFMALVFRQPDHPNFTQWEMASLALVKSALNINQKITIGNCLVLYYSWIADLPKCRVIMESVRENITQPDVLPLTKIIWYSMEAMYAWLGLKPSRCEECVTIGLAMAKQFGIHIWDFMLNAQGTYGKLSSGQLSGAGAYLKQMSHSVSGGRFLDGSQYHYLGAWVSVLKKDYPQALEKIKFAHDLATDAGSPFPKTFVDIALSQMLFEQGEKSAAITLIKQVNDAADSLRSRHFKHHSFLMLAYFHLSDDQSVAGIDYLKKGFKFARENHFLSLIWWRPEVMSKLCGIALLQNIETPYVKELIIKNRLSPDAEFFGLERWPWQVKITSFGHFTLSQYDKVIAASGKSQAKPLELLKVLVSYGGQKVSETKITDCLWPDAEGDMAHHSFNTTLYRLRKLLGCDKSLLLNGAKLSLNPALCWTDVWAFEMMEKQVILQLQKPVIDSAAIEQIEMELFYLYQGSFLSLESEKPWVFIKREKERSRFIRIAEQIGKFWFESSQFDNAIRFYQKTIEVDHLVESFYQQLILAYQQVGRKAEANSVYKQCEQSLSKFGDIKPSEKTKKIYRDCMSS